MHVNAKKMAFGGLALAVCVLLMALGSVFESSTLFFLACASFFVGILIREMGIKMGVAFYLASVLLGFLTAPNKFYVLSYAAMSLYILLIEGIWKLFVKGPAALQKLRLFWTAKYLVFNCMYVPAVLLFQKMFFGRSLTFGMTVAALAAGQVALWVYDHAYDYVQAVIWPKIRGRIFRAGE